MTPYLTIAIAAWLAKQGAEAVGHAKHIQKPAGWVMLAFGGLAAIVGVLQLVAPDLARQVLAALPQ